MCVNRIESAAVLRMTRRELCTQIHTNMARITIRLDEQDKNEFQEYCERHGETMSGVLKDEIRDAIGTSSHGPLPDDPELAKAYRVIYQHRSDDNRVAVADVEGQIANVLNTPKGAVRRRILEKLDKRGYINVKVGIITANVELNEQPAAAETDASGHEVPADD